MIWFRLGMWICYNLNCSLLKHIVSLTIISGSPFKHGKHESVPYIGFVYVFVCRKL